jgi:hypothetical protein
MAREIFDDEDDKSDCCLDLKPDEYKRYLEIVAVHKAVERITVAELKKRFTDKKTREETLDEVRRFVEENDLNFESALAALHLRDKKNERLTFNYYRKDMSRNGKPESD